jgi:Secretion system C-terminal sorting domain
MLTIRNLFIKDKLIIPDLTGRLVKNFKTIQNNEFDVSDLTTGVYFVSVLRDDHKLFTKKLMVSR